MLTINYVALADQTQKPVRQNKSTRGYRHWSWNPKNRKPSKCIIIDPKTYDKERTQC